MFFRWHPHEPLGGPVGLTGSRELEVGVGVGRPWCHAWRQEAGGFVDTTSGWPGHGDAGTEWGKRKQRQNQKKRRENQRVSCVQYIITLRWLPHPPSSSPTRVYRTVQDWQSWHARYTESSLSTQSRTEDGVRERHVKSKGRQGRMKGGEVQRWGKTKIHLSVWVNWHDKECKGGWAGRMRLEEKWGNKNKKKSLSDIKKKSCCHYQDYNNYEI